MPTYAEIKQKMTHEAIERAIRAKESENGDKPEVLKVLKELREAVDLAFD